MARRDGRTRGRGRAPENPPAESGAGLINVSDPIPTYIAASGPKARALTARVGAGWIDNVADPEKGAATLAQMRTPWRAAGRDAHALTSVAWIGGAVLERE